MSAASVPKQQQVRRRINHAAGHQSRNTNAYIDRAGYHRRSLIDGNPSWNHDYHPSNEDFYLDEYYQRRCTYPSASQHIRKGRQTKQYHSKAFLPSSAAPAPANNKLAHSNHIPPRHRRPLEQSKPSEVVSNVEPAARPAPSPSSSSANSGSINNAASADRKDLHAKNLAAAAIAARQQHPQPQTNLGVVQALMNSLILQQQQQQQQQPPAQSPSTVQLQYQLTNALLATSMPAMRV